MKNEIDLPTEIKPAKDQVNQAAKDIPDALSRLKSFKFPTPKTDSKPESSTKPAPEFRPKQKPEAETGQEPTKFKPAPGLKPASLEPAPVLEPAGFEPASGLKPAVLEPTPVLEPSGFELTSKLNSNNLEPTPVLAPAGLEPDSVLTPAVPEPTPELEPTKFKPAAGLTPASIEPAPGLEPTPFKSESALETSASNPEFTQREEFSVDYNIPTLDDIALPSNEDNDDAKAKNTVGIPIPEHILRTDTDKPEKKEITLSPELFKKLNNELLIALIPEIEKSISFALNSALATVMDNSSRITKTKVRQQIEALLPTLLEQHLTRIANEEDES